MLNGYISKNLKEGEVVIRIVRRYPINLVFRLIGLSLVVLLDFFLLTYLFQRGRWGIVVFFGVLVSTLMLIYRSWFVWTMNVLLVTNLRIIDIDQRGFFTRTVSETTYHKIQDVSYSISGLLPTIFHYGVVTIQTAGTQTKIQLDFIHHPETVQELLTNIQDQSVSVEPAKS